MESRKMTCNCCCGNCLHFHNEDAEGKGWCYKRDMGKHCSQNCLTRGIWESTARRTACCMNLKTTRMNEYEYLPDWAIID